VSITYGDCCLKAWRTRYNEHGDPWESTKLLTLKNGEEVCGGEEDNIFDEDYEFRDYMDDNIFYKYRLENSRF
jgi:hypothetical protein